MPVSTRRSSNASAIPTFTRIHKPRQVAKAKTNVIQAKPSASFVTAQTSTTQSAPADGAT
eukprot:CAMPEP_0185840098 /NCGR_PEP_ID=MMETSP1353-20130828/15675_1 /TAXON_ID=1077150 /ORGANISM="Erythrolobus australicus, Strain CCMP3124" /LENGTH=59 /DNA_ID=CAMNT_0028539377 /DNA_START=198 /DNA_END=373 /DNA_ORIENTATION=-